MPPAASHGRLVGGFALPVWRCGTLVQGCTDGSAGTEEGGLVNLAIRKGKKRQDRDYRLGGYGWLMSQAHPSQQARERTPQYGYAAKKNLVLSNPFLFFSTVAANIGRCPGSTQVDSTVCEARVDVRP